MSGILFYDMKKFNIFSFGKLRGEKDLYAKERLASNHYPSFAALYGLDSFATMELAVNISTYFTNVMHFDIDEATKIHTNFMGTSYILSIVAAYISDAYLARYKVIIIFAAIEILEFILLTIDGKTQKLKPSPCNPFNPTSVECIKVRGDQFEQEDPIVSKKLSSYFNWLLLISSVGSTFSLVLTVWVHSDIGWGWGFGISIGAVIFVIGVPRYRVHAIPRKHAVTCVYKGVMEAIRISYAGYPSRHSFDEFLDRFGVLALEVLDGSFDEVTAKRKLLEKVKLEG